MFCAITGYSLASGMCTALDTLVSQAFGAKLYKTMGLHCQRAIAILSVAFIFIVIIWCQTEYILQHLMGIDPEVSKLAGVWAKVLALGLWPQIVGEFILSRFLQSQQIVWPLLLSSLIATVSNIALTHVFVHFYAMGFYGCVLGYAFSKWVYFIAILSIIILRKCVIKYNKLKNHGYDHLKISDDEEDNSRDIDELIASPKKLSAEKNNAEDPEDNWPSFSRAIFEDWETFLHLACPGAASLFMEW